MPFTIRDLGILGLTVFALVPGQGCSVLTKSQVQEVNAFAKASENYGTLPSAPVRAYGDVNRFEHLVVAAGSPIDSDESVNRAWTRVTGALSQQGEVKAVADQTDAALDVIENYSAMLKILSSDQYSEDLEKSAGAFGKSVDKAISTYNDKFVAPGKAKLSLIGGAVAGVIRGGGGIYLRHRQAVALKEAVTSAQPVVAAISADIVDMMRARLKPALDRLEERLRDDFKTSLKPGGKFLSSPPPLTTYVALTDGLERLRASSALAETAAVAAEKYATAHGKLLDALSHRQTLKDRIEDIQTLADEIQAADKLRRSVQK